MERWDEVANAQRPLMQQHTPHTYAELLGQAEGAEIDPHGAFSRILWGVWCIFW